MKRATYLLEDVVEEGVVRVVVHGEDELIDQRWDGAGREARRAAKDVQRIDDGHGGETQRRLTDVPPTPRKPPSTPKRPGTPGTGRKG